MGKFVFVVIVVISALYSGVASARTWRQPEFTNDKGFNPQYVFSEYQPVEGYEDPDRTEALQYPSPLYNPLYASYDIVVVIRKSDFKSPNSDLVEKGQRMSVYVRKEALERIPAEQLVNLQYDEGSGLLFYWKTSTARPGANTPEGHYLPQTISSDHYSTTYHNAPMPYAVFFVGDIATHGVLGAPILKLGTPASAGCSRLEPQRAKDLFHLIGIIGKGDVTMLSRDGVPVLDKEGNEKVTEAYSTLIIVRP